MKVEASAFVAECRSLLGVRWHHCGRNEHGLDCSGLPLLALKRLGVELDAPSHYSRSDELRSMIGAIERHSVRVWGINDSFAISLPGSLKAGDLLVFRNEHVGARCLMLNHLGVYTGEGTFVHAWESKGRVCETPLDPFWQCSIYGIYRLRCLEEAA